MEAIRSIDEVGQSSRESADGVSALTTAFTPKPRYIGAYHDRSILSSPQSHVEDPEFSGHIFGLVI